MSGKWNKIAIRAYRFDLEWIYRQGFSFLCEVRAALLFSNHPVSGIYALCDRQSMTIGLFPLARKLGPIQRREALIHELCHLHTDGLHGRAWKRLMHRVANSVFETGDKRLAKVIRYDVSLYENRPVTWAEILRQLDQYMKYLDDKRWTNVSKMLADWAGWSRQEFIATFPKLRKAWLDYDR